ncbi:MAG: hypothetical protein KC619_18565 [Myxococcales bacterium]|nr:hypothetical protein [Myxococcales bacterium]
MFTRQPRALCVRSAEAIAVVLFGLVLALVAAPASAQAGDAWNPLRPSSADRPSRNVTLRATGGHRGLIRYTSMTVPWERARDVLVRAIEDARRRQVSGYHDLGDPRWFTDLELDQTITIRERAGNLHVTIVSGLGTDSVDYRVELRTGRIDQRSTSTMIPWPP